MPSIYNGHELKMKYLFVAQFEDGTEIKQTLEDKSSIIPTKSSFYDVLEYQKTSPLVRFRVQEVGMMGLIANAVVVDLRNGEFKINGIWVNIADQNFIPQSPLNLVYFRETRVEQDINVKTHDVRAERFYINRYFVGWETEYKGQKYQRTVAIGQGNV